MMKWFMLIFRMATSKTGVSINEMKRELEIRDYKTAWVMAHIICGEIMLIAIPFTKLSHVILFFLSRAQIGMDYGIKRGGMKGKGLAW